MGLFSKTNLKATPTSIVKAGGISAAVGVGAYLAVMMLGDGLDHLWYVKLPVAALLCGLIGGLGEWQNGVD